MYDCGILLPAALQYNSRPMSNQPAINRELLTPILIGGLSVIGIVAVLMIGRVRNAPAEVALTPSSTPFQYIYLGTEPAITTLVVEGSELSPSEEPITEESATEAPIILPTAIRPTTTRPTTAATTTRSTASTSVILTQPNATRTATSTPSRMPTAISSTAAVANTYDDTDSRLNYSGSWINQPIVGGAYEETLHISYTVGNSVTFTFTGQEIYLYYLPGPSLGIVTITFDSETLGTTLNQAQGDGEWTNDELLTAGAHTVVITHTSGGSVNIDRIVIPAPTPTPTRTPTP